VVRGSIKIAFLSPQGEEKVVDIALPGQSFGEAMLFLEQRSLVSARALADSALLHISGRVLSEELARDASLARSLLAGLSQRLHALLHDAGSDALRSGAERLVAYLLRGGPFVGEAHEVALPRKSALASRLSMTPEHFSRLLRKLEAEQLIEVRGRVVRLVDPERLRGYRG
jgi:CRP-like cAMP-binding protein